MSEFPVIFSLAVAGSLVRWSAGFILKLIAPKAQGETSPAGLERDFASAAGTPIDPVTKFGFILACDGIIVLGLVSALPGALPLERTGLAFAFLCVGGLIGEISGARAAATAPADDALEERIGTHRPPSRGLSLALALALNLGVAVFCAGQGLIAIMPPKAINTAYVPELDPVIVVAQRTYEPYEEPTARF